jgi:hypothetical protein
LTPHSRASRETDAPGLPHAATSSALAVSSYTLRPSLLWPTTSRRANSPIPSDITFPRSPTWERRLSGGSASIKHGVHCALTLYERLYCARGEAENRIKEAQLDLFGTCASCRRFAANQLRLLLAALAYTLMHRLRSLALKGSDLERATAATIRVRLLKIGAAIVRNTRRVRVLLASHHPLRELFALAAARLASFSP